MFQGHGCVPLDEINLTVRRSPRKRKLREYLTGTNAAFPADPTTIFCTRDFAISYMCKRFRSAPTPRDFLRHRFVPLLEV